MHCHSWRREGRSNSRKRGLLFVSALLQYATHAYAINRRDLEPRQGWLVSRRPSWYRFRFARRECNLESSVRERSTCFEIDTFDVLQIGVHISGASVALVGLRTSTVRGDR